MGALAAHAHAAHVGHCLPEERTAFSCTVRGKSVSLCAAPAAGPVQALAYRYGRPGLVENEFVASAANGRRFFATVMPAAPGALVRQVWFDRGDVRYVVSECSGPECAMRAGLAVIRRGKLLSRAACEKQDGSMPWLSGELVRFGSEVARSESLTPILKLEETDNLLLEMYGAPAAPR